MPYSCIISYLKTLFDAVDHDWIANYFDFAFPNIYRNNSAKYWGSAYWIQPPVQINNPNKQMLMEVFKSYTLATELNFPGYVSIINRFDLYFKPNF